MVVEEGLYHLGLVGLIAPLHLAPERSARGGACIGQGREGQDRRSGQFAGQEEPSRRAVGIPRRPRRRQISGETFGQRLCGDLIEGFRGIRRSGQRKECLSLLARGDARHHLSRPGVIALIHQRKVQQPFAGIVDNVEVQRPHPAQRPHKPAILQAERQPQFADRPRALRPVRIGAGQRGQMRLIIEARHGIVRLRLQEGRADAPL